jgi:hypothetical protein
MGVAKRRKVIKLCRTKALRTRNPANRENSTVIECISASGRALKPLLILKGKVITTDFIADLLDDYMLSVSDTGWTNNDHGLYWLENIFKLETRDTKVLQSHAIERPEDAMKARGLIGRNLG